MFNLRELRDAEEPYKNMRVHHDLTPKEREEEKRLLAEAKQINDNETESFFWMVKGLPGVRKVVRIPSKKKVNFAPAPQTWVVSNGDQPQGANGTSLPEV